MELIPCYLKTRETGEEKAKGGQSGPSMYVLTETDKTIFPSILLCTLHIKRFSPKYNDSDQINVVANILLVIAKVIAAFGSSSLSLIASLVDSSLDLLCTLIIWTTSKLVQWRIRRLQYKFPVGRRRLEPLGILVFSIIMVISFLQILQESVTKLLPGGPREAATLPPVAIGALVATIVVKGTIWFGCIRVETTQVQALAQGTYPHPHPVALHEGTHT